MRMESISSKEMVLSYKKGKTAHKTSVAFDPPLLGFEEVRPRLLASKFRMIC